MLYPERQPAPAPAADRLLAGAGFTLHRLLARRLSGADRLAAQVRAEVRRLRDAPLAEALPTLRYRLRRAGFTAQGVSESFGLYCAALAQAGADLPAPEALAGARWIVDGGIVELAQSAQRRHAVALAAFTRGLWGGGAHLLAPNEPATQVLAAQMAPALERLGLPPGIVLPGADAVARRSAYAGAITCAPLREAGLDYLRDRASAGGRPGAVRGRMARLAGAGDTAAPLTLNGLHSAIVLDADLAMLDEARLPIVVARDVDRAGERLLYEQAMELARALRPAEDFQLGDDGVGLLEPAAGLLARLSTPLGGVWADAERREDLVRLALEVLHGLQREVHYRVEEGRVLLPPRPPEDAESHAQRDAMLQMLLEVKEGCRTSPRREVLARISVPAFLGRYLHLGGACADARGLEAELWRLYGLKAALAGRRAPAPATRARVFATTAQKHDALLAELQAGADRGVVLAVRSPAGAKAAAGLIADSGVGEAAAVVRYPGLAAALPERTASVLVIELPEARRHVAQLCEVYQATQCRLLIALDEEMVAAALGAVLARRLARYAAAAGELTARMARVAASLAQRGMERQQAALRQEVASRDQYLRDLLAFSGEGE